MLGLLRLLGLLSGKRSYTVIRTRQTTVQSRLLSNIRKQYTKKQQVSPPNKLQYPFGEQQPQRPRRPRDFIWSGWLWLRPVLIGFIVCHLFFEHFYDCRLAYGISMLPTISSYGTWLVTSKRYRRGKDVEVGDIVSYTHPVKLNESAVKRVIGMSGDFVLRDTPGKGEGQMIQIPQGHCWVVGDNLSQSRDSRHFGPLPMGLISGKVVGVLALKYACIPYIRPFSDPFVAD